jgi:hypothetical protein
MVWDEVYCGWLPVDGGGVCGISLLQQVTCHQMLLPSSVQPNKRSSWSGGGNVCGWGLCLYKYFTEYPIGCIATI